MQMKKIKDLGMKLSIKVERNKIQFKRDNKTSNFELIFFIINMSVRPGIINFFRYIIYSHINTSHLCV